MAGATASAETPLLPPLRNDLKLFRGPRRTDGSRTWTIHDPVRNRFFRIGLPEFELLSRWARVKPEELAERVCGETVLRITAEQVQAFGRFLDNNELSAAGRAALSGTLSERASKRDQGVLAWLLLHYLFVRIPLFKPDRFLDLTYPYVRFLFRPMFAWLVVASAILGAYLVTRQWETFIGTFLFYFTWDGAVYYAIALVLSKILHELGHGYTA